MRTFIAFIVLIFTFTEVKGSDSLWMKRHTLMLNKPFPAFSLQDMYGKTLSSSSLKGKVTMEFCWETSCLPCLEALPHISVFVDSFKTKEFQAIAFARNNRQTLVSFLSDTTKDKEVKLFKKMYANHTLMPILPCCGKQNIHGRDSDCILLDKSLKVIGYPTVLLTDKKGIVRYANPGFIVTYGKDDEEQQRLAQFLERYFAELKLEIDKLLAE